MEKYQTYIECCVLPSFDLIDVEIILSFELIIMQDVFMYLFIFWLRSLGLTDQVKMTVLTYLSFALVFQNWNGTSWSDIAFAILATDRILESY